MAKGGTVRLEQIRQAQKLLNELPPKDDRKTRQESAEILEKDFRKAFKKGYTPKELSQILKNAGIIIPAFSLGTRRSFSTTDDKIMFARRDTA